MHTASSMNGAGALPPAIHIVVVVYGKTYSSLLADITLPNLGALVQEIPDQLRMTSKVRILTTEQDSPTIERANVLPALRQMIDVEILKLLRLDFKKHGLYGPMVETQRLAVVEAARAGAAIFFVGPDQIYNRGAFAAFLKRFAEGYRVVIGPGVRVKREAVRPILNERIAASSKGMFALEPQEQINLFFRNWHPINDQFVMGGGRDIGWKAYVYYRPSPNQLFIRFFQGPTFAAWPRKPVDDFDGYIDHNISLICCESVSEAYVVSNGLECLALDLTDDMRKDIQPLSVFPRTDFLLQLSDRKAINDLQLLYGVKMSIISCDVQEMKNLPKWRCNFDDAILPLIYFAISIRRVEDSLGLVVAKIYKIFLLINVNFLSFLFKNKARHWLKSEKTP